MGWCEPIWNISVTVHLRMESHFHILTLKSYSLQHNCYVRLEALLCCACNMEQAPTEAEAVQFYFTRGLQITCRKAGETVSGGLHMYCT